MSTYSESKGNQYKAPDLAKKIAVDNSSIKDHIKNLQATLQELKSEYKASSVYKANDAEDSFKRENRHDVSDSNFLPNEYESYNSSKFNFNYKNSANNFNTVDSPKFERPEENDLKFSFNTKKNNDIEKTNELEKYNFNYKEQSKDNDFLGYKEHFDYGKGKQAIEDEDAPDESHRVLRASDMEDSYHNKNFERFKAFEGYKQKDYEDYYQEYKKIAEEPEETKPKRGKTSGKKVLQVTKKETIGNESDTSMEQKITAMQNKKGRDKSVPRPVKKKDSAKKKKEMSNNEVKNLEVVSLKAENKKLKEELKKEKEKNEKLKEFLDNYLDLR